MKFVEYFNRQVVEGYEGSKEGFMEYIGGEDGLRGMRYSNGRMFDEYFMKFFMYAYGIDEGGEKSKEFVSDNFEHTLDSLSFIYKVILDDYYDYRDKKEFKIIKGFIKELVKERYIRYDNEVGIRAFKVTFDPFMFLKFVDPFILPEFDKEEGEYMSELVKDILGNMEKSDFYEWYIKTGWGNSLRMSVFDRMHKFLNDIGVDLGDLFMYILFGDNNNEIRFKIHEIDEQVLIEYIMGNIKDRKKLIRMISGGRNKDIGYLLMNWMNEEGEDVGEDIVYNIILDSLNDYYYYKNRDIFLKNYFENHELKLDKLKDILERNGKDTKWLLKSFVLGGNFLNVRDIIKNLDFILKEIEYDKMGKKSSEFVVFDFLVELLKEGIIGDGDADNFRGYVINDVLEYLIEYLIDKKGISLKYVMSKLGKHMPKLNFDYLIARFIKDGIIKDMNLWGIDEKTIKLREKMEEDGINYNKDIYRGFVIKILENKRREKDTFAHDLEEDEIIDNDFKIFSEMVKEYSGGDAGVEEVFHIISRYYEYFWSRDIFGRYFKERGIEIDDRDRRYLEFLKVIKTNKDETNLSIEEYDLDDLKEYEDIMSDNFKRLTYYPKLKAERYNDYYGGLFIHTTHNIESTLKLLGLKKGEEDWSKYLDVCCSTVRANTFFRINGRKNIDDDDIFIIIGMGEIKYLYDFDAYTTITNDGRRVATVSNEDEKRLDLHVDLEEYYKKSGNNFNADLHYDEGIVDLKEAGIYMIVGNFGIDQKIKISKKLKELGYDGVKFISFEEFFKIHDTDELYRKVLRIKEDSEKKELEDDYEDYYKEGMTFKEWFWKK